MRPETIAPFLIAGLLCAATPVGAATYGELSQGAAPAFAPAPMASPAPAPAPQAWPGGPYAPSPQVGACGQCSTQPMPSGAQGVPPAMLDAPGIASLPPSWFVPPEAGLPVTRDGRLPNGAIQMWSYGQVNQTTDPYNAWGLSTPFMFVPWSTPLSGWTNSQTWNWWRERSGARSPAW